MRILTHPSNIAAIKAALPPGPYVNDRDFIPNPFMEREKETGKYILPSGRVVPLEDVKVHTRFIDYGPEDIDWLLTVGAVTKEITAVVYVIEDQKMMERMWGETMKIKNVFSPSIE